MLVLKLIGYWKSLPPPSPHGLWEWSLIDAQNQGWPDVRKLVDPGWRSGDRARIVRYLRAGHHFTSSLGSSACRFECGINRHIWGTGSCELTDGEWAWPEGLAHYVERHAVRLPDEFVETMEARGWLVPGHGAIPAELAERINPRGGNRPLRTDITVDPTFWESWSAQIRANRTGAPRLVPGRFGCLRMILRSGADLDDDDRYWDATDEIEDRLREADCGTFCSGGSCVEEGVEQFIEGIAYERWVKALDIVADVLSRHGFTARVAILRVEPDKLEPHRDREPVECACGKDAMGETERAHETEAPQTRSVPEGASLHDTQTLPPAAGSQPPTERLETFGDEPFRIGRYRVLHLLGVGGFTRVFLARDEDLDRLVAIKVLKWELTTVEGYAESFLNEARIAAKLDHPHIVPVYEVGRTEEGLCLVVLKFIDGTTLSASMNVARPSFRDSAELVATVADALHYAHARGLVHGDVKPGNILTDAAGKVWLADFGKGEHLMGNPSYMSPEQVMGEGHPVDGRSDIFSLGVVFYTLLTGCRPFQGHSGPELIRQVVHDEAQPPRQIDGTIPTELERVCRKAMSKRASERYSTAKEMADELRLFLDDSEGAISPAAWTENGAGKKIGSYVAELIRGVLNGALGVRGTPRGD